MARQYPWPFSWMMYLGLGEVCGVPFSSDVWQSSDSAGTLWLARLLLCASQSSKTSGQLLPQFYCIQGIHPWESHGLSRGLWDNTPWVSLFGQSLLQLPRGWLLWQVFHPSSGIRPSAFLLSSSDSRVDLTTASARASQLLLPMDVFPSQLRSAALTQVTSGYESSSYITCLEEINPPRTLAALWCLSWGNHHYLLPNFQSCHSSLTSQSALSIQSCI